MKAISSARLLSLLGIAAGILATTGTAFATENLACTGLGTNDTDQLTISGNTLTITHDGGVQTATLQANAGVAGSSVYSGFTPPGFVGAQDQFVVPQSLVSTGKGTLTWEMANVNPVWTGNCHTWGKADTTANSCPDMIDQDFGPVAKSGKADVTLVKQNGSSALYQWSATDGSIGSYVYDLSTQMVNGYCRLGKSTPTSCLAVIADAVGSRAIRDGSSAGSPSVTKQISPTEYGAYVNDDESGPFSYDVTVTHSGSKTSCVVESITPSK